MKELNENQVMSVSGGVDVSDMFAAGAGGALAGGSFGAGVGATAGLGFGSIPAAAVFGLLGAGVGFISGITAYALSSE